MFRLAAKYGMIPVYKENFASLFEQRIKDKRNVDLLKRMSALEVRHHCKEYFYWLTKLLLCFEYFYWLKALPWYY